MSTKKTKKQTGLPTRQQLALQFITHLVMVDGSMGAAVAEARQQGGIDAMKAVVTEGVQGCLVLADTILAALEEKP